MNLGVGRSIGLGFRNMFDVRGTATRAEFWPFFLFSLGAAEILLRTSAQFEGGDILRATFGGPLLLALVSLTARRLREACGSAILLTMLLACTTIVFGSAFALDFFMADQNLYDRIVALLWFLVFFRLLSIVALLILLYILLCMFMPARNRPKAGDSEIPPAPLPHQ